MRYPADDTWPGIVTHLKSETGPPESINRVGSGISKWPVADPQLAKVGVKDSNPFARSIELIAAASKSAIAGSKGRERFFGAKTPGKLRREPGLGRSLLGGGYGQRPGQAGGMRRG